MSAHTLVPLSLTINKLNKLKVFRFWAYAWDYEGFQKFQLQMLLGVLRSTSSYWGEEKFLVFQAYVQQLSAI